MTKTKVSDAELLARINADADQPIKPPADGAPLRDLARAAARRQSAETAVAEAVARAHAAGISWGVIGAALGISRQGARQRYGTQA